MATTWQTDWDLVAADFKAKGLTDWYLAARLISKNKEYAASGDRSVQEKIRYLKRTGPEGVAKSEARQMAKEGYSPEVVSSVFKSENLGTEQNPNYRIVEPKTERKYTYLPQTKVEATSYDQVPVRKTTSTEVTPVTKSITATDSRTDGLRYQRPISEAITSSFSNIFNFGIIGEKGLKTYTQQALYEPFEYVGTQKAYKTVGYTSNPDIMRRASEANISYKMDTTNPYINATYLQIVKGQEQTYYSTQTSNPKTEKDIGLFRTQIFEPPAYKYITTVKTIGEIGALTSLPAFAGSSGAYAVSTYLTAKTYSDTVNYQSNFNFMTTSEKVIGGAGLVLEGAGALGTYSSATKTYFSEWRNIRYNDLINTRAKVTGREVIKTDEQIRYIVDSERVTPNAQSRTLGYIDLYPTSENSVGIFSKGVTKTKIYDPETFKYITTTQGYKFSGNVPFASEVPIYTVGGKVKVSLFDATSGRGTGIYTSNNKLKEISFYGFAEDKGDEFLIGGGKPFDIKISKDSTKFIGNVEYTGSIKKLNDEGVNYMLGSSNPGTTASTQTSQNLKFKTEFTPGLASGIQNTAISELKQVTINPSAVFSMPSQSFNSKQYTSIAPVQQTKTKQESIVFDQTTQKETSKQRGGISVSVVVGPKIDTDYTFRYGGGFGTSQPQPTRQTQINPTIPIIQVPVIPTIPNPFDNKIKKSPDPPVPYIPKFSFEDLALSSNIIKGGKQKKGYTPSFTAIIKNITSTKAPKRIETGLNFRPILIKRRKKRK